MASLGSEKLDTFPIIDIKLIIPVNKLKGRKEKKKVGKHGQTFYGPALLFK